MHAPCFQAGGVAPVVPGANEVCPPHSTASLIAVCPALAGVPPACQGTPSAYPRPPDCCCQTSTGRLALLGLAHAALQPVFDTGGVGDDQRRTGELLGFLESLEVLGLVGAHGGATPRSGLRRAT